MKAVRLPSGSTYYAHEHNALVNDASAAASLLVHQKLGAIALGTTPTNGQTVTFDVNGTNVVFTAVTGTPTNPGDVKAPGTAIGFVANVEAALQNPTVSTSTFIALSAANAQLINFLGWSLPVGTTTITPFSLNTTTYAPLTSFTASTTVTSGTYTASTMQLYVEPGTYYLGIVKVIYAGGATTTFTAPVTHPRIDIVTLDSSGTLAVTTGTEATSPVAPTYPANKIVLCEVTHSVGETSIFDNANQTSGQGFISNDSRPVLAPPYISSQSQLASGVAILDPGSEAQGDILYWNGSAWVLLAPGTSGFFLQTLGASANPQWAQPVASTASGATSFSGATGTQAIAHGLGRTPQFVRIAAMSTSSPGSSYVASTGDSNNVCVFFENANGTNASGTSGTLAINIIENTSGPISYTGTITVDATNINIAWIKTGSANPVNFVWEAQ